MSEKPGQKQDQEVTPGPPEKNDARKRRELFIPEVLTLLDAPVVESTGGHDPQDRFFNRIA